MYAPNVNQITSQLARMNDQQLQQYAAMHKNDPYIVSLALSESNHRKETKIAQQGQLGQQQQPKVNDQAIAGMILPEESGIARLPIGEAVPMHYADGGIVAFAGGQKVEDGGALFNQALAAEGITDPRQIAFLRALHGQESGGKATSVESARGAKGPMQVLPNTFKEVAPELNINNSLDNMRGGIRYGLQGYNAAKGDPVLAGAYYYGGPGGMAALSAGNARVDPQDKTGKSPNTLQYGNSVASRMTAFLPMGSAQAETQEPSLAQTGAAARIPTGGYSLAPAAIKEEKPGFFSRIGTDIFGMSDDSKRNFSNLTQAFGGAMGAGYIPNMAVKGAATAERGIAALAPAVESVVAANPRVQAAQAAQAAARAQMRSATPEVAFVGPPRLPAVPGAAQTAGKLPEAAQVAPTAQSIAQLAPKVGGEVAQVLPRVDEIFQASQAARRVGNAARTGRNVGQATVADNLLSTPETPFLRPVGDDTFDPNVKQGIKPADEKTIIAETKKAMPEQKGKGFTGEDWLTLGLLGMAGKSQYALQNLGEAGLGVLASKKEQKKAESTQAVEAMHAKYYGAAAEQLNNKEMSEKAALDAAQKMFATRESSTEGRLAGINDPTMANRKLMEFLAITRSQFPSLGGAGTIAQAAPATDPAWGAPIKR